MKENIIYNENCLEGLEKLPEDSIDLVVTDPPYSVGTTSTGGKGLWTDNNLIEPFFDKLFGEIDRVLKDESAIYLNTDWRTYPIIYPILMKYFDMKNLIVWDYEWIKAGMQYRFSYELIIYAVKGKEKREFSAAERDVWRIKPINFTSKNKLHPSQKPVELIKKMIINSSHEGDTILDCFMGSGTTAVACLDTKRKYIGYELNNKYYDTAIKRVEDHQVEGK